MYIYIYICNYICTYVYIYIKYMYIFYICWGLFKTPSLLASLLDPDHCGASAVAPVAPRRLRVSLQAPGYGDEEKITLAVCN